MSSEVSKLVHMKKKAMSAKRKTAPGSARKSKKVDFKKVRTGKKVTEGRPAVPKPPDDLPEVPAKDLEDTILEELNQSLGSSDFSEGAIGCDVSLPFPPNIDNPDADVSGDASDLAEGERGPSLFSSDDEDDTPALPSAWHVFASRKGLPEIAKKKRRKGRAAPTITPDISSEEDVPYSSENGGEGRPRTDRYQEVRDMLHDENHKVDASTIGNVLKAISLNGRINLERILILPVPIGSFPPGAKGSKYGHHGHAKVADRDLKTLLFFMAEVFSRHPNLTEEEIEERAIQLGMTGEATHPCYFKPSKVTYPRVVVFEEAISEEGVFHGSRLFFIALDPAINIHSEWRKVTARFAAAHRKQAGKARHINISKWPDSPVDHRIAGRIVSSESYKECLAHLSCWDIYLSEMTDVPENAVTLLVPGHKSTLDPTTVFSLNRFAKCAQSDGHFGLFDCPFVGTTPMHMSREIADKSEQMNPMNYVTFETDSERRRIFTNFHFPYLNRMKKLTGGAYSAERLGSRCLPIRSVHGGNFVEDGNDASEKGKEWTKDILRRAGDLYNNPYIELELRQDEFPDSVFKLSKGEVAWDPKSNVFRPDTLELTAHSISASLREYDIIEDLKHRNEAKLRQVKEKYAGERLELEKTRLRLYQYISLDPKTFEDLPSDSQKEYAKQLRMVDDKIADVKLKQHVSVKKLRDRMADQLIVILNNPSDEKYVDRLSSPLKETLLYFSSRTHGNTDCTNFWWHAKHGSFHGNLGYFGSFMVRLCSGFENAFRIKSTGENLRHLMSILVASLSGWLFEIDPSVKTPNEDEQMYNYTMNGPPESSKSFLMRCIEAALVNGTTEEMTHTTMKAFTAGRGDRDLVYMHHEVKEWMIGSGPDGDRGAEIAKDMQKGFSTSNRLERDEESGKFKPVKGVTMCAFVNIQASNVMVSADKNAMTSRQQIEHVTRTSDDTNGAESAEMYRLVSEVTKGEFKQLAAPFVSMTETLQTIFVFTAQFVRSRAIEPIRSSTYDIISSLLIEELDHMGVKAGDSIRTIKRGHILACVLGYINAIGSEYLSPYGVKKHQVDPTTRRCSRPFDPKSIVDCLSPLLFVTVEVAVFAISCLQFQFVRLVRTEVWKHVREFFIGRYPITRRPSKVVVQKTEDKVVDKEFEKIGAHNSFSTAMKRSAYDPVHEPDFLTFYDSMGEQMFKKTGYSDDNKGTVTFTYDPNLYHIQVASANKDPLGEFARLLAEGKSSRMARPLIRAKLDEMCDSRVPVSYVYPERKEVFSNASGRLDKNSLNIQNDRRCSSWKAIPTNSDEYEEMRDWRGKVNRVALSFEVDRNKTHIYHVYVLRQAADRLIGATTVNGTMKLALERVIRRLPGIDHDMLLLQVHYGNGINAGGKKVKKKFSGLLEIAETRPELYRNDSWRRMEHPVVLKNVKPMMEDHRELLSDGMSPSMDTAMLQFMDNQRVQAEGHMIDQPLDLIEAKNRARDMDVEFDPSVTPRERRKTIIAWQLEQTNGKNVVANKSRYPHEQRKKRNRRKDAYVKGAHDMLPSIAKDAYDTSTCTTVLEQSCALILEESETIGETLNIYPLKVSSEYKTKEAVRRAREMEADRFECDRYKRLRRLEGIINGVGNGDLDLEFPLDDPEIDAGYYSRFSDSVGDAERGTIPSYDCSIVFNKHGEPRDIGAFTVGDFASGVLDAERASTLPKHFVETPMGQLMANMVKDYKTTIQQWISSVSPNAGPAVFQTMKVALSKLALDAYMFDRWMDLLLKKIGNSSSEDEVRQYFRERTDSRTTDAIKNRITQMCINNGDMAPEDAREERRSQWSKLPQEEQAKYDTNVYRLIKPAGVHLRPSHDIFIDPMTNIIVERVPPKNRHPDDAAVREDGNHVYVDNPETKHISDIFADDIEDYWRNYVFDIPDVRYLQMLKREVSEKMLYDPDEVSLDYVEGITLRDVSTLSNIRKKFEDTVVNPRSVRPITVKVSINRDKATIEQASNKECKMARFVRTDFPNIQAKFDACANVGDQPVGQALAANQTFEGSSAMFDPTEEEMTPENMVTIRNVSAPLPPEFPDNVDEYDVSWFPDNSELFQSVSTKVTPVYKKRRHTSGSSSKSTTKKKKKKKKKKVDVVLKGGVCS